MNRKEKAGSIHMCAKQFGIDSVGDCEPLKGREEDKAGQSVQLQLQID